MQYETLKLTRDDAGIAVITLDRPAAMNSINQQLIEDLRAAVAEISSDEGIHVLILTGGGRAFCAGADLNPAGEREPGMSVGESVYRSMERGFNPLIRDLAEFGKPLLVAVNGVAAGGGVGLALSGDIVVAAQSARFIQVFVPQLGIIPDMGCTHFLVRLLGRARARGLALLGDPITAQQAEQWGMIWKAVPDDQLMEEAQRIARRLAAGPAKCFGYVKRALDAAETNSLSAQLDLERDTQRILCDTEDFLEGVSAFLSKRKPQFKGQ